MANDCTVDITRPQVFFLIPEKEAQVNICLELPGPGGDHDVIRDDPPQPYQSKEKPLKCNVP